MIASRQQTDFVDPTWKAIEHVRHRRDTTRQDLHPSQCTGSISTSREPKDTNLITRVIYTTGLVRGD